MLVLRHGYSPRSWSVRDRLGHGAGEFFRQAGNVDAVLGQPSPSDRGQVAVSRRVDHQSQRGIAATLTCRPGNSVRSGGAVAAITHTGMQTMAATSRTARTLMVMFPKSRY